MTDGMDPDRCGLDLLDDLPGGLLGVGVGADGRYFESHRIGVWFFYAWRMVAKVRREPEC